ncbi:MAG: hypothetical protein D6732_18105 [Methanobacteriota archaeon]|nr:MAG: hypothetical protein D6732_18105 [Euryarchaeota archaeon]
MNVKIKEVNEIIEGIESSLVAISNEGQCRCPSCKGIVSRGIRVSDSWVVAVCSKCGIHPVEGVYQLTPPAMLERGEVERMMRLGYTLVMVDTGNNDVSEVKEQDMNGDGMNKRGLNLLNEICKELNLSVRKLAKRIGKQEKYFYNFVYAVNTGKRKPNLDALADGFEEVLKRYLLNGELRRRVRAFIEDVRNRNNNESNVDVESESLHDIEEIENFIEKNIDSIVDNQSETTTEEVSIVDIEEEETTLPKASIVSITVIVSDLSELDELAEDIIQDGNRYEVTIRKIS